MAGISLKKITKSVRNTRHSTRERLQLKSYQTNILCQNVIIVVNPNYHIECVLIVDTTKVNKLLQSKPKVKIQ